LRLRRRTDQTIDGSHRIAVDDHPLRAGPSVRQLDRREPRRQYAVEPPEDGQQGLIEEVGVGPAVHGGAKRLLHHPERGIGRVDRLEQRLLREQRRCRFDESRRLDDEERAAGLDADDLEVGRAAQPGGQAAARGTAAFDAQPKRAARGVEQDGRQVAEDAAWDARPSGALAGERDRVPFRGGLPSAASLPRRRARGLQRHVNS
jgi:hypothetical protein